MSEQQPNRADTGKRRKPPAPMPPSRAAVTAEVSPTELSRAPEPAKPHKPVPIGSMLGKYRVRRALGHGGMGTVYEAEDTLIKRRVAIKVLAPELAPDASVINRLLAEAQAAGKLNHPNVVTIYDVDRTADGTFYIVMELVAGGSVQDYLARRGSPGWRAATRLVAEACKALGAAHENGLIHRDVKPSNLMLTADGHVKVTDFGLAKVESSESTMQTQPGAILGTPSFMSPEQCRGDKLDARTDVYSLGCTYYAMLTGKPPFEAASSIQVMFAHCSAPIPDPREAAADAPDACVEILNKALAKDPQDRYANAREMLADLRAALGGATTINNENALAALAATPSADAEGHEHSVWQPSAPRRPLPLKWIALGAVAAVSIVAAGVAFWKINSAPDVDHVAVAKPQAPKTIAPVREEPEPPAPAPPAPVPDVARNVVPEPTAVAVPATSPAIIPAPPQPSPVPAAQPALRPAPQPSPPVVAPEPEKPAPPPESVTNSVGMNLALMKPGKFFMGDGRLPDAPRHEVTLTRAFYIGTHEVSQAELRAVMGSSPREKAQRDELPVAFASWDNAAEFCRRLGEMPEERAARRKYRLPTEAEWEYACRADTTTKFAFGDNLTQQQANFGRKISLSQLRRPPGGGEDGQRPPKRGKGPGGGGRPEPPEPPNDDGGAGPRPLEPVGSFAPNAWGLHDMHGNVWEWCSDFYAPAAYKTGSRIDPKGPESGRTRVARGGAWNSPVLRCASAARNGSASPDGREPGYGFRVVCEIAK